MKAHGATGLKLAPLPSLGSPGSTSNASNSNNKNTSIGNFRSKLGPSTSPTGEQRAQASARDKEGTTTVEFDKVARYTGKVKNCLRDGMGTYKFSHGGNDCFQYEGTWTKGVRQGHDGHFTVSGYSQYTGDFANGEITGVGRRTWADGRVYEGEFLNGEMCGNGKWSNHSGSERYEGQFKDNKRHGFGTLQSKSDIYRGEFSKNQFHGPGVYLYSRQCIIKSVFKNNLMNGPTLIKWLKHGTLEVGMVEGYAEGKGYFVAEDDSFDYEGAWEAGYPSYPLIAKYIWSDIEKPAVVPQLDAKGKPIQPKQPAKGNEPGGPSAIVAPGSAVGKVIIKTNTVPPPVAPAAPAAAVKGKPPAKGEELAKPALPEPDTFAVPCERSRRVTVTVRKIKQALPELSDEHLDKPIHLWLRNKYLSEFGSERFRFPPSCTLFIDGDCAGYGSSRSSAPTLLLENAQLNDISPLASSPATIVPASAQADEMSALKISKGICLHYKMPVHELSRSHESMTFVVDFKIDVNTLATTFRSALQTQIPRLGMGGGAKSQQQQSQGGMRAASSSAAAGKRAGSHRNTSSAASTTNAGFKQFVELNVLTLSRCFDGAELVGAKLVLVLIVPDNNLKKMAKKIAKLNKEASSNAEEANTENSTPRTPGAPGMSPMGRAMSNNLMTGASSSALLDAGSNTNSKVSLADAIANAIGGDLVDIDWTECTWELRLITTNPSPTADGHKDDINNLNQGSASSVPADAGDHTSTSGNNSVSSIMGALADKAHRHAAHAPHHPPHVHTHTTVCGRWRENAFSCAQWHSVALTLRSNHGSQDSFGEFEGFGAANNAIISLIVDGSGRIRVPVEHCNSPSNISMRPHSQASNTADSADVGANDGVLLAWLPENPVVIQHQQDQLKLKILQQRQLEQELLRQQLQEQAASNNEATDIQAAVVDQLAASSEDVPAELPVVESDKAEAQAEPTNEADAIVIPKYEFSMIVRIGGEHFVGFIKCVATCSE
jgi:hypothetical protein